MPCSSHALAMNGHSADASTEKQVCFAAASTYLSNEMYGVMNSLQIQDKDLASVTQT
jgi:hypothetical protein